MKPSANAPPFGHQWSPAELAWRRAQSLCSEQAEVPTAKEREKLQAGVVPQRCTEGGAAVAESQVRYTTSIRTPDERILVHVTDNALAKLDNAGGASELQTLAQHMPQLHGLAIQLAAQGSKREVLISAAEIWWCGNETGLQQGPQ